MKFVGFIKKVILYKQKFKFKYFEKDNYFHKL